MSSLINNFISRTFNSILKLGSNESFTGGTTTHVISDGLGNVLPISFTTGSTIVNGTLFADKIIGGSGNISLDNTYILGNNITANTVNTTYVESINIKGNLYDGNGNSGNNSQIIMTNGSNVLWTTVNVPALTGDTIDHATFKTYTANTDTLINTKLDKSVFLLYSANTANVLNSKLKITTFNAYTSDTSTTLSTKLNVSDFNTYSSNTNTVINNGLSTKLNVSDFNPYSAYTLNTINSKLTTTDFNVYSADTKTSLDNKVIECLSDHYGSTIRTGLSNIISGNYSTISGGRYNTINIGYSTISGGYCNTINAASAGSIISGGYLNTLTGEYATINGGTSNQLCGDYSIINGGLSNTLTGLHSFVGGGASNDLIGNDSSINSGQGNKLNGNYSSINSGVINSLTGNSSTILGGSYNTIRSEKSIIGIGDNNNIFKNYSAILGGYNNTSNYENTFILGTSITANATDTTYVDNFNIKRTLSDNTCSIGSNNDILKSTSSGVVWTSIDPILTNSSVFASKLSITNFNIYTANTNTLIGGKYDKTGGIISGNVTITGNLIINGSANTVTNQNIISQQPIIILASGTTNPINDAGLIIDRGITGDTTMLWSESNQEFRLGFTNTTYTSSTINIYDYANLRIKGLYSTNIYDIYNQPGSVGNFLQTTSSGITWSSISNKLNVSDFNLYSSYTNTNINNKYDKTGGTIVGNILATGDITGSTIYGTGGFLSLGTPSDGSYNSGLLGITSATTINYAVDQIDSILALLAPAKPPRLDASSYITPTFNSAIASRDWSTISGQTQTNVIFNTLQPVFKITGGTSGSNTGFYNGVSGSMRFYVNGVLNGGVTLSPLTVPLSSGNSQTNLGLSVNVNDYYIGQTGKSGFWSAINATGQTTNNLNYNTFTSNTYNIVHSDTGGITSTFYIDNPSTPTISNISIATPPTITRYVSGVPSISSTDSFIFNYDTNKAVSKFYNSGTFSTISGSLWSNNTTSYLSSSISPKPISGQTVSVANQSLTASSGKYSETPNILVTGYNAQGTSGTNTLSLTGYRIDTISSETSRRESGNSQPYPTSYGNIFVPTTSLLTGNYIYELQQLNGIYIYPITNYVSFGGPNYTTATGTRYLTLNLGNVSNASNMTLTINGTGFSTTSNQITDNFTIHTLISGSTSTGWLNGNSPYSSGSPSSNGDSAMDTSNSTQTSTQLIKRITFGSITRSGAVYTKVGLPVGSTKTITSITLS